jgi:hypothetical protein
LAFFSCAAIFRNTFFPQHNHILGNGQEKLEITGLFISHPETGYWCNNE